MEIIDKFHNDETIEKFPITRFFPDAEPEKIEQRIATEHHMSVLINTIPTFEIVCSPDHLPQLVLGRLLTEGVIQGEDEVSKIFICDRGNRAEVLLKDEQRANFSQEGVEKVSTCCTGNKTLNDYFHSENETFEVVPIKWEKEWIFQAANFFKNDSPAHKKSFGTHSCYLFSVEGDKGGKLVPDLPVPPIMCEDLGRHNALDKAIGCALERGTDLKKSLLFTSGRLPIDMVEKVIRAKIPILVSKAVPTISALELAKSAKLTLICSAYPDAFDVYLDFTDER